MTRDRASLWTLRIGSTLAMFGCGTALAAMSIEILTEPKVQTCPPFLALVWIGWVVTFAIFLSMAWRSK